MKHNTDQHLATQAAAKASAREQVGFNLAGYLDDFSKALSVCSFPSLIRFDDELMCG
jgi:hypothetical protein